MVEKIKIQITSIVIAKVENVVCNEVVEQIKVKIIVIVGVVYI